MEERTRLSREDVEPIAWLVIASGPTAGQVRRLSSVINIGREPTLNDLVLDDAAVSAQHARIRIERGQYILYDLASANGTFVNGQRIYRWPLMDGDRITIGGTNLVFKQI
jgi:pSer/pThr/pTyr-binding forkhead associated (FHA) protein